MNSVLEVLKNRRVLVADGAMGTMLFERGLNPGECPERWNLERADVLEEIARLYLQAGAEIIQTNTFGGSALKLAQYGLDGQTEAINAAAVRAVRKAVGERAIVSGSCGPCGRLLEPYGDIAPDEVAASFRRQMTALVEAGVDQLCIETMIDLAEAVIAIETAREIAPSIPIVATMTFDPTPRGFFTVMGTTIEQAAAGLAESGADIIGSNCGNGIEDMVKIASEFANHTDRAIIIQSNAGLPQVVDGQAVYSETPEFMASHVPTLIDSGVRIIGGCCGTTPAHITAIRDAVAAHSG